MKIVDELILFFFRIFLFSLKILFGSSLHFVSIRVFIVVRMRNVKSQFQPNRAFLEWVASLSYELTAWPNWKFCPVMLPLSWPFSSTCMLHMCANLAICQSWDLVVRLLWIAHILSFLHTLSHTTLGYLIVKLQANLVRNKANTWLNKFSLTLCL